MLKRASDQSNDRVDFQRKGRTRTMGNVLLVTYDLRQPGRNYNGLYQALRTYAGPGSNTLESVWLINTNENTGQVRDKLKQYIDANDRLAVFAVSTQTWATYNVNATATTWLNRQ
jgi:hypothetical protein